jgi:flavorubredoxin
VVIVYSSMYGNNARVADTLAAILSEEDVQHIKVHDVSESEISEIIADLFRYTNAVIFGMNYNTELFPKMDALLREITMLNYQNRKISYIAAKSWGGRGVNIAQDILSSSKDMTQVGDIVTIAGAMGQDQLSELEDLAKAIKESL